jgi:hypothetical protein
MFRTPERSRVIESAVDLMGDPTNGRFEVESVEPGWSLLIIASDGDGWEHVSVHARRGQQTRTPTWKEMTFVKSLFWEDEDVVVQFHPRRSEYVNTHPNVLHLWRPVYGFIPTPPTWMVG